MKPSFTPTLLRPYTLNPVDRSYNMIGTVEPAYGQRIDRAAPVSLPVPPPHRNGITYQYKLGDDVSQMLALLRQLAANFGLQPAVRNAAISIISSSGDEPVAMVNSIIGFVRSHVRYAKDPKMAEYVISPLLALQTINVKGYVYGDCDDHVLLLASLLTAIGFDNQIIGVKLNGSPYYNHVINQVRVGGQWHDVDTCFKSGDAPNYQDRLI